MDAVDVDQRIVSMLRRGERDSARELMVREYDGAVASLCRGMVRDPRAAEDLKQDAFVAALEAIDTHRGDGTIRAWLLRIARNRCLDHLRRRTPVAIAARDPDDAPDPYAERLPDVVAGMQRAEIALSVLDPEDRALVLLHHVHGVEYAELTSSFSASEGSLRMRMQRALARMRESLERLDRSTTARRRRVPRELLWVSLTLLVIAALGVGTYYRVVKPQRAAAETMARQIEQIRQETEFAQRQLEAARRVGAGEEELRRLREQLAASLDNQQSAASGDAASNMRAVRRPAGSVRSSSSIRPGACMGPLCGLMRSP